MRKATAVWTIAILGFMICWGVAARAQDAAPSEVHATKKSPLRTPRSPCTPTGSIFL